MRELFLKTKFFVPQLHTNVVNRDPLIKKLDAYIECKLTLISAPAGFGKSTLVSEWITGCNHPVAWLSLDEKDNDLIQFISYFITSLEFIEQGIGKGLLESIRSFERADIESILTILINDITSMSNNFVFVLDDYHVIDKPEINNILIFLLDHMPTNMHLVITTRVDPLFPLAKLRSKNQLLEIRAKDLRFTHSEISVFLNGIMDLNISDNDILILETRTEGWIAGLQLAAISMKEQKDLTGFIESFSGSHHYIMDYLIEEVINQQSEEIQSFLLKTSILNRFCGSLCDAIEPNSSSSAQEILEDLIHKNLFVVPLDNERKWYRYHHLFSDLLKRKLLNEYPLSIVSRNKNIAELHLRASKWCENNELTSEAIHHAVEGKDFEQAADLLEMIWSEMDKDLQSAIWFDWMKKIPDELIRFRPILSVGYAWALLDAGQIEGCEVRLLDAEKCMDQILRQRAEHDDTLFDVVDEEKLQLLPSAIATARAYIASALGDVKASIKHAKKALDLMADENSYKREVVNTVLGLAQWANGELEDAYLTITHGITNIKMEIMVAVVLAEIRIEQGKLQQAYRIYEKGLQAAIDEERIYKITIASFYLGLGKIKLLKGDLNGVEVFLQKSFENGEIAALSNWRYNWYLLKARLKENQGELDQALDLLDKAERYYNKDPLPDLCPISALKTRVFIKQGKICKALIWVNEQCLGVDDKLDYLREFEHITLVRVLLAEYRHLNKRKSLSDAKQFIRRLILHAQKGKRIGHVIELHILQALIHDADGDLKLALECLKVALDLAEPEEYFQIFIDEGFPMHRLLSNVSRQSTDSIYKMIIEIDKIWDMKASELSPSIATQSLIEPLSKREHEVLLLIAEGFTNREICERLFLALSTVKNYNQNLFGKLQVKNRTEAIKRASELGILKWVDLND